MTDKNKEYSDNRICFNSTTRGREKTAVILEFEFERDNFEEEVNRNPSGPNFGVFFFYKVLDVCSLSGEEILIWTKVIIREFYLLGTYN